MTSTADHLSLLRNPSPDYLRRAARQEGMAWLPVFAKTGEMFAEALEIADESSRALIESHCVWVAGDDAVRWYDTRVEEDDAQAIAQAVRYLEWRGLLTRREGQGWMVTFGEGGE